MHSLCPLFWLNGRSISNVPTEPQQRTDNTRRQKIPKRLYQWYNWENRASYNNLPENSFPGTPGLRATPTATNLKTCTTTPSRNTCSPAATSSPSTCPLTPSSSPANSSKTTYLPSAKTPSPWPKYTSLPSYVPTAGAMP